MKLVVQEWGNPDAPPLFCIHGVGGARVNWRHVAEDRWGRRFRVIAPDLRGHGDSGYLPPWTHATYVDDLVDTLDDLGLEKVDMVGHSFGGRLVLELLARFPDRVGKAVVTEPVIQITPELAMHRAEQERVGGTWASFDAFLDSRENTGEIDRERYLADLDGHFEELADGSVRRRTCQSAIVSIFSEFASPAPSPETVTVPTMLLYSPAFGMVTPEQIAAYQPQVAEIVGVPGLHSVFTSAYQETTTAIERFLLGEVIA
ncbi:MAG: alpha/beta hydrolase [Nocardioides sp.]|uniref:alpha/beta fold hydrolase n=1 Tax=Nocardioides sp. TaxID=35761 RepID=UPI0039E71B18